MIAIQYIKQKRQQNDYCNICGRLSCLTWDHVPPKCITHGKSVIANTAFSGLPQPDAYMKKFQNGIKYRSICRECNNAVLGENDKIYQDFIKGIDEQLRSKLALPRIVVPIKINRLCRAMVGHVLAAQNSYEPDVIPDQKMRQYVQNQSMRLSELKLYAWLYPYNSIVIARDFVAQGFIHDTHPKGMVSAVVSVYPLAYMITDQDSDCGVDDLGRLTTDAIEDEVDVTLHFKTAFINGTHVYKPFNWPLNPNGDTTSSAMFVIGGQALHEDSRVGLKDNESQDNSRM